MVSDCTSGDSCSDHVRDFPVGEHWSVLMEVSVDGVSIRSGGVSKGDGREARKRSSQAHVIGDRAVGSLNPFFNFQFLES